MIVAGVLVRERQGGRIEDARFTPEEAEQARRFFDAQPGKGPFAQRAIEQQDARRVGRRRCRAQHGCFWDLKAGSVHRRAFEDRIKHSAQR